MKTFGKVRHEMLNWAAAAIQPPEEKSTLVSVTFKEGGVTVVSWGNDVFQESTEHSDMCQYALDWVQGVNGRPPVEFSCECGVRWECISVEFSSEGTSMQFRCPSCKEETGAMMWSAEGAVPVYLHIPSRNFTEEEKRLMFCDPDEIVVRIS